MAAILIVDDDPDTLKLLAAMLAVAGHETTTAEQGDAAIAMLADTDFDLALTDLRMGPVDGMKVLTCARKLKPNMPVVLITGDGSEDIEAQAGELGAYACVTKPITLSRLLDIVGKALGGS